MDISGKLKLIEDQCVQSFNGCRLDMTEDVIFSCPALSFPCWAWNDRKQEEEFVNLEIPIEEFEEGRRAFLKAGSWDIYTVSGESAEKIKSLIEEIRLFQKMRKEAEKAYALAEEAMENLENMFLVTRTGNTETWVVSRPVVSRPGVSCPEKSKKGGNSEND